jgi:hypothetical protein
MGVLNWLPQPILMGVPNWRGLPRTVPEKGKLAAPWNALFFGI